MLLNPFKIKKEIKIHKKQNPKKPNPIFEIKTTKIQNKNKPFPVFAKPRLQYVSAYDNQRKKPNEIKKSGF